MSRFRARGPGLKRRAELLVLGLTMVLVARSVDAQAGRAVRHPVERYLVPSPVVPAVVRIPENLDAASALLPGGPVLLTIGQLEGPDELVFGQIKDAVLAENGDLFVLDSRFGKVRVFDRTGRLRGRFGRPGRGPGEFSNALSLALDEPNQRAYVGDLARLIHVFSERRGQWVHDTTLRTPVAPTDMCVIRDQVVIHGTNVEQPRLIHILDRAGRVLTSFGSIYNSGNPLIDYQVSQGSIACDPSAGLIAYAAAGIVPEVRAFDLEGQVRWVLRLDGFRAILLRGALRREYSGGSAGGRVPQGPDSGRRPWSGDSRSARLRHT